MTKYIDAEKLKYEIERRKLSNYYTDTDDYEAELFEIIGSLQQEQMEETYCPRSEKWKEVEETARHEYEKGWKDCKEQMLKEAVEGVVFGTADDHWIETAIEEKLSYVSPGDKVRVIVLPQGKLIWRAQDK